MGGLVPPRNALPTELAHIQNTHVWVIDFLPDTTLVHLAGWQRGALIVTL